MRTLVLAALAAVILSAATALAGPLSLPADQRWAVLASRQSLEEAIDIARIHGRTMPGVRVARASNGWFAIVAGPLPATSLERAKPLLGPSWRLPDDLYLSRGEAYLDTAWTARPLPILAEASWDGETRGPVVARHGDLAVTLATRTTKTGERQPVVTGRVGERVVFEQRFDDDEGAVRSRAKIVVMDRAAPRPQVVLTAYTGGAHCCTLVRILSEGPDGRWRSTEGPRLDGDDVAFEDLDGDGTAELVDVDNSFFYAFDSYAGSFAPDAYFRFSGGVLRDATADPAFREALKANLRGMERSAAKAPELWRSNGFLAGWAAAKARLGEAEEAFARIEPLWDRTSTFGPEECATGLPLDRCRDQDRRRIPFPRALRDHLVKAGYPVPPTLRTAGPAAPAPVAVTGYADAQAAFQRLPEALRYEIQMLLAATGAWPAVSTDAFSRRLYEAIGGFQAANRLAVTGAVGPDDLRALRGLAAPVLAGWGLRPVVHPVARVPLWVPEGLGLRRGETGSGLTFERADRTLRITFDHYPRVSLQTAYGLTVADVRPPATVTFKVLRDDFFVVSAGQGDAGVYVRFQALNGGIVGFRVAWTPADGIHGDRLTTLMSDLFRANVGLGQFRAPPTPMPAATVAALPPAAAATPPDPPAPAPGAPPAPATPRVTTGSGFFVTPEGHMLTNAHVVDGCERIVVAAGETQDAAARVIARDGTNDLALLKTELKPKEIAALRPSIRLGESIAVFGFPLTGLLASGGNFTLGNVTALAGLRNDSRILQISAPVQPGNSGGPLLDETGAVVGVVVAKLNAVKLAAATDDIPQNVNFAIKAGVAGTFADSQGLALRSPPADAPALKPADLADRAKAMSGLVTCGK